MTHIGKQFDELIKMLSSSDQESQKLALTIIDNHVTPDDYALLRIVCKYVPTWLYSTENDYVNIKTLLDIKMDDKFPKLSESYENILSSIVNHKDLNAAQKQSQTEWIINIINKDILATLQSFGYSMISEINITINEKQFEPAEQQPV
jgi:hypothetical protein